MTLTRGAHHAIHIRRLLHTLGILQTQPVTAFEDNQAAIDLSEAPAITAKSRHINMRYHLIRDYVHNKTVQLKKVAGTDNPADLLTKTLSTPLAERYADRILNVSSTPLVPLGVGGSVGSTVV